MKYFSKLFLGLYLLAVLFSSVPSFVFAQANLPETGSVNSPEKAAVNQACNSVNGNGTFSLCNPLSVGNFCDLVKALLNIVLAIGVPIAVLFLVWAGFKFILARGSQEGLATAKRNFMYVIVGIAIFLGSWTLATVISATIQSIGPSIQLCTNTA